MTLLLLFLYHRIDVEAFRQNLLALRWLFLPIVYVLLFVNTALNSWKWQMLLQADGFFVRYWSLIRSHLIATFFNLFLPSSIGGDAYRVMDVGQQIGMTSKSFAAVFAERLVGFLALACWGLLFSAIGYSHLPDKRIFFLPVLVFALMIIAVVIVLQRRLLMWGLDVFRMKKFTSFYAFVQRFLDSLQVYHANKRLILKIFALSLIFQLIAIVSIFLLSRALDWDTHFIYFCIFVPLITLAKAIPISIFGIGIRDGCYVFFFAQAGVAAEKALALAMVYVFTTILYSLFGGIIFMFQRRKLPPPAR